MSGRHFRLESYLERINHACDVAPTLECLYELHAAQLYTIAFENLDIHLGRAIELGPDKLFQKLVRAGRGGYCFELNGLFLLALREIGFDAHPLLGRVHLLGEPTGRGHQVSLVTLQGEHWIVDTGFGADTPREPLRLQVDTPVKIRNQTMRFTESTDFGFMLQVRKDSVWENLYSLDMGHACPGDIAYGNYYTSTNPDSIFVTAKIAVLPTQDGLVTLFNNSFTRQAMGKNDCQEIVSGERYLDVLENSFGIRPEPAFAVFK